MLATTTDGVLEIDVIRAHHQHVVAMADIFLDSFEFDGSVKLMYSKEDMWGEFQQILHDYMDNDKIEFRLAVTKDSELVIGWMSFALVPDKGPVPEYAFNEMTSWAAQRLLRGNKSDPRFRLAAELEDRSRHGQRQHMDSRRIVINTGVTDPKYRRLGVADKLLKSVVEHARGIDCSVWAQIPSVYASLFWRNEFHEVGAFGLDLNVFKPPEEVAKGIHGIQLGFQTWRQMKLGTRAEELLEELAEEMDKPTGGDDE